MNNDTRIWLQQKAIMAAPNEACGFIMENGDIIEIRNVAINPKRTFHMDYHQMVEKLSDREDFVKGIWHTHPGGSVVPSYTDLSAIKMGAVQSHWDYWIVTADGVHLYEANRFAVQNSAFWGNFT